MRMLIIELQKIKRAGVIFLMLAIGILGGAYAFINFIIRKDILLNLSVPPMDVLLTQVYGMVMILNMFGIIVASCIIYNLEFKGSAVKKMYMLPISVSMMYFCKFLILTVMLFIAICLQNFVLAKIGILNLPKGTFEINALISFAGYSFLTSMPVLSFMVFVSSRFENMWISLGIGVVGFLSAMTLVMSDIFLLMFHPFVVMLKPAVAMSAQPNIFLVAISLIETLIFLYAGLWTTKNLRYE